MDSLQLPQNRHTERMVKTIELLNEPHKITPEFRDQFLETTKPGVIAQIDEEINKLLVSTGTTLTNHLKSPRIELAWFKDSPAAAFLYPVTNTIYVNQYTFEISKRRKEKAFPLIVKLSLAHLLIHEKLHTASNLLQSMTTTGDTAKYLVGSGVQQSKMLITDFEMRPLQILFLPINEAITDLLAFILYKKTNEPDFHTYLQIQKIDHISQSYFPFMFILIQLINRIAKKNQTAPSTVFKSFIHAYFNGEDLSQEAIMNEIRAAFNNNEAYENFKRIKRPSRTNPSSRPEGYEFVKKYWKCSDKEIMSAVVDFVLAEHL